jgi:hypothetical protein
MGVAVMNILTKEAREAAVSVIHKWLQAEEGPHSSDAAMEYAFNAAIAKLIEQGSAARDPDYTNRRLGFNGELVLIIREQPHD